MRKPFYLVLLALIAWVGAPSSTDAKAKAIGASEGSVTAAAVTELAAAPAAQKKKNEEVKAVPNDKPNRSQKNPNDGKDGDPDDGDAGSGNDDKTKKNDGPAND